MMVVVGKSNLNTFFWIIFGHDPTVIFCFFCAICLLHGSDSHVLSFCSLFFVLFDDILRPKKSFLVKAEPLVIFFPSIGVDRLFVILSLMLVDRLA